MEVNGQLHALASLSLGKKVSVPIGWEVGWTPQLVWMLRKREKFLSLPGIEPCEWAILLLSIREVPGSNFGPGVGYPDRGFSC
jgi:hypothetical protein